MGTGELSGKPDEMLGVNLRWTSIPSWRSSNTTETGISSGCVGQTLRSSTFKATDMTASFLYTGLENYVTCKNYILRRYKQAEQIERQYRTIQETSNEFRNFSLKYKL